MAQTTMQVPLAFAIALLVAVAAALLVSAMVWRAARTVGAEGDRAQVVTHPVAWTFRAALVVGAAGVVVAIVAVISSTSESTDEPVLSTAADPWTLVWSDEFDGDDGSPPDPASWTHETGGGGWGNEELQYYTDSTDNAALDGDGHLVITAREIDPAVTDLECWYGPCTVTSARLVTAQKYEFTYGRIESRVRVPDGAGIWPAVWMLGADHGDVGWPQTGEIDVMEFVGRSPNEIFGTIHGPGYSGGQAYGGVHDLGFPVSDEWHEFTVDWSPEKIVWAVDGIEYHEAEPADIAPNEWVFDHPFFLLTNMAVGGNFGGPVQDDVEFPLELTVDYVRVFQTSDVAE